jgi:RNA polymerase sigma-70 factor (ECF subfamily)
MCLKTQPRFMRGFLLLKNIRSKSYPASFRIFILMICTNEYPTPAARCNGSEKILLSSFPAVFEQYRSMLYAIALRMLGHGEDAKDAVQESFIKAYTQLHTLKNDAALAGWLKSIVCNYCLMELRYRKKKAIALNKYASENEVIASAEYAAEKAPEEIKNTLAYLSETLQLTTMLRFFSKNSSYNEIATILSIPVGTVRSRLAESRSKLASILAQQVHLTKSNKAKEMEDFYQFHFLDLYNNAAIRNAFLDHFDEHVFISLTSGATKIGAEYMKKEIEFDLNYGARATLAEVNSSGNVSVLELNNINPADNPNLCPSSATFIVVHPKNKVEKIFLHNAPPLPHWS